jgi:hypothetical protein
MQKKGNIWSWGLDKRIYAQPLKKAVDEYYIKHRSAPPLQTLQKSCGIKNARAVRGTLEALTIDGALVKTPDNRYIPAWALL